MADAAAVAIEPVVAPAVPAAPAAPVVAAVPPAAPPAKDPTSILDPGTGDDPVVSGDWPDDWREKYTIDDKRLKQLKRFGSPKAVMDAFFAAQQKITSGELVARPGKDAAPEVIKAWRESQGIPEAPDGYLAKLPDGLVIGETDKELIGAFAADLHSLDAPPAIVHKAIDFYYKTIEQQRQDEYETDREARQQTEDALRADFGQEYRRNINIMSGILKTLPGEAGEMIANARGADGVSLLNHPDVVRGLVELARQINPVATLIPGATNVSAVGDRLKEIKTIMSTDLNRYRKDPAMQEEYQKLLQMQERLSPGSSNPKGSRENG